MMQSGDDTAGGLDTLVTNAYNSKAYNSILDQEASAQTATGEGTYAEMQTSNMVSVQQNNLS